MFLLNKLAAVFDTSMAIPELLPDELESAAPSSMTEMRQEIFFKYIF